MNDKRPASELPKSTAENLSAEEQAIYEWQIWTENFGESGQRRLKNSAVFISRCGGLGSVVAYELAAAGVGRLIIAHAGNVVPSDLNRQLLMTHDWIGKPRVESVKQRLHDLNPRLIVDTIDANVDEQNAEQLIADADVCVSAAPMFEERLALSDACVRLGKPLVNCAMFDTEATIQTFAATGRPCLRCTCPEVPKWWKRQFPVFGAVSGTVACMGAFEAIKLLAGFGENLFGRQLHLDLLNMRTLELRYAELPFCRLCESNEK